MKKLLLTLLLLLSVMGLKAQTPYAIWCEGNSTLYFIADGNNYAAGETFYGQTITDVWSGSDITDSGTSNTPSWNSTTIQSSLQDVVFDSSFASVRPTSMYGWFNACKNLHSISGLEYLNTSNVTSMGGVFFNCTSLTSLDLSHFDTSNVTDMYAMFYLCRGLTSLDVSHFDTSNVTDMRYMFCGCTGLIVLDLSDFVTPNVKKMVYMFYGCRNLKTIYCNNTWTCGEWQDYYEWKDNNYKMFLDCTSLIGGKGMTYDESKTDVTYANPGVNGYFTDTTNIVPQALWCSDNQTLYFICNSKLYNSGDTYNDQTITEVWSGSDITDSGTNNTPSWNSTTIQESLQYIEFDSSFIFVKPSSLKSWFNACKNLHSISGLEFLNTSKVTEMNHMFDGCSSLTNLYLSKFNTSNVTDMGSMFHGCSSLKTIYCNNTWSCDNSSDMFTGCTSLVGGQGMTYDESKTDIIYANPGENGYFTNKVPQALWCSDNQTLYFICGSQLYNQGDTYNGQTITNVWSGSVITDSRNYPAWTSWDSIIRQNLQYVVFDLSFASVSPTSLYGWFYSCQNICSISGLEYLNTSNVKNMSNMFAYCYGLTSLSVSEFNTSNVTDMSYMFSGCRGLTSLDVSKFNTSNVTNMRSMFSGCSGLTSLDVSHFDTSNVTDMYGMFEDCSGLTSLDVSKFNTSNVTNMKSMFSCCSGLTSLDVSHFDTSKVTRISHIFERCSGLTSLDVTHFDTSNVTDMSEMFYGCRSLTSLDVTHFDTSNVRSMYSMFAYCNSLTNLDVTHFVTSNVWEMSYLFDDCRGLTNLDVTHFDTSNVEDMSYMFRGCTGLTSLDLSHFDTSNVWNMNGVFRGCTGLTSLDLSNFDTSNVTDMVWMFKNCINLSTLDLSRFDTSKVTDMMGMFSGCNNLVTLDLSNFSTESSPYMDDKYDETDDAGMFYNCINLTTIYCDNTWSSRYSTNMFRGCTSLVGGQGMTYNENKTDVTYANPGENGYFTNTTNKVPQALWCSDNNTLYFICDSQLYNPGDTYNGQTITNVWSGSNITDTAVGGFQNPWWTPTLTESLQSVVFDPSFASVCPTSLCAWFSECENLCSISGLEYLNTSNVTDMSHMFYYCKGLTSLALNHFDTSNVTNMQGMFISCGLTSLDLSGFNTSNVTNMALMFTGCNDLTSLNISHFDTSNVTSMTGMFWGCLSLTSLDVSHFDTSNVMGMYAMFCGCSGLRSLDLSNFDTSNVTDMEAMFKVCSNLKTIYCNDTWSCDSSSDMFSDCTSLVGGQGMTYDENKTDVTYANPGENGYFTATSTAINDIEMDKNVNNLSEGVIYDLSGRPVGDTSTQSIEKINLQPGIYILNGKKISVR